MFHKVLGFSAKISDKADTWHELGFLHCAELMALPREVVSSELALVYFP